MKCVSCGNDIKKENACFCESCGAIYCRNCADNHSGACPKCEGNLLYYCWLFKKKAVFHVKHYLFWKTILFSSVVIAVKPGSSPVVCDYGCNY